MNPEEMSKELQEKLEKVKAEARINAERKFKMEAEGEFLKDKEWMLFTPFQNAKLKSASTGIQLAFIILVVTLWLMFGFGWAMLGLGVMLFIDQSIDWATRLHMYTISNTMDRIYDDYKKCVENSDAETESEQSC